MPRTRSTRLALAGCFVALAASAYGQSYTSTPNIGLQIPAFNSPNWQVSLDANFAQLDAYLSGKTSVPGLHVAGSLQVDGTLTAPNLTFSEQQLVTAIGYTPLSPALNLSDLTNPSAALATLGGLPASIPTAWSNTAPYALHALVIGSDGATYEATVANTGNNPTAAGSTYWGKLAGGATAAGAAGSLQVAGSGGLLAVATPGQVLSALPYTPLNPANNGSDFTSPSAVLSNIGGASASSVATATSNASAALTLAQSALPAQTPTLYASGNTYALNALATDGAGDTFRSLQSANKGNPLPSPITAATAYWALFQQVGSGTAAAGSPQAVQFAGSTNQFTADNAVQIAADHSLISAGPRVNVRDSMFALGWTANGTTAASCVGVDGNTSGYADPTGTYNSECAVRSAALYASTIATSTVSPVLYFPAGYFKVSVSGYTGVLVFTKNVDIAGDGRNATTIENDSPLATLVTWNGTSQPSLHGITLQGNGSATTGDLIEVINAGSGNFHDFHLQNTAGNALNMQGGSEREKVYDFQIFSARRAILTNGNTNEDYFHDFETVFDGATGNYFYDVNSVNGVETTGAVVPDPRAVVYLDGDNLTLYNGSVKGTRLMGVHLPLTTGSMRHVYCEADDSGTISSGSGCFEVGGKLELSQTTAAISATSTVIPVDDAQWQPCYVSDPALMNGQGICEAYTGGYRIYPADYVYGSTAASTAAPGVLKGQYENVAVNFFAGDGAAHLSSRSTAANPAGSTGTAGAIAAFAWPTGSVIEVVPVAAYGTIDIAENHINMVHVGSQAMTCSDTTLQTTWHGNPSETCKDGYIGYVPDGYAVQFPSIAGAPSVQATMEKNSVYFGATASGLTSEQTGQGHVLLNDAYVGLGTEDQPLSGAQDPAIILGSHYYNGYNSLDYLPSGSEYINDPGIANIHAVGGGLNNFSSGWIKFQDSTPNGAVSTERLGYGGGCDYGAPNAGTTQPLVRNCYNGSGTTMESYYGGAWHVTATNSATGFTPNLGITYPIDAYVTTATYTIAAGKQFSHYGGTGTVTLPTNVAGQRFALLLTPPASASVTIAAPSGLIQAPGVSTGSTYIASAPGTYEFEMDGSNYEMISYPSGVNAFPTIPSTAFNFTSLQNTAGTGTWTTCNGMPNVCGGGGEGTATVTTGVASPSLSGSALQLTATNATVSGAYAAGTSYPAGVVVSYNGSNYYSLVGNNSGNTPGAAPTYWAPNTGFNALLYRHIGCPTGGCGALSNMVETVSEYWTSSSGIQAIETDPDLYYANNEYFGSVQCDSASGDWRLWNMSGTAAAPNGTGGQGTWVTTPYSCSALLSQANTWHTLKLWISFNVISGTYTYKSLAVDGNPVFSELNQTYYALPYSGAATINVENQLDLTTAATTNTLLVDNESLSVF